MIICSRLIKAAWIIVPAFAVSMLMAHAARASEPVVLGLEQLIQMALDTSPEIKEAEQDVKAAQSDLAQAKGGRWAQLELVATMGPAQNASEPIVAVDPVTFKGKLEDRDKNELGFSGAWTWPSCSLSTPSARSRTASTRPCRELRLKKRPG